MNDGPLLSGWERAQALEIGYYAKPQLWRVYLVHVFAERICHESCNGSQAWVENTHTSHGVSTKTWSSTVRYPYTRSFARTYNYILFLGSCSTQGRITCISQNRPQDNLPQFAPRHYCMCKHSLSLAYERIFLRENERAHTYRCTRFRLNSCSIRCDTSKHRQLGNRRQFVQVFPAQKWCAQSRTKDNCVCSNSPKNWRTNALGAVETEGPSRVAKLALLGTIHMALGTDSRHAVIAFALVDYTMAIHRR